MALFELRAMNSSQIEIKKSPARRANILLRLLGPGLVTGAADDDPSGIANYSQAGAQFGYGLLWTVFLTTPFMIAVQLVSAHIGRATGQGIVANVKDFAPRWVVISLVSLVVMANTFTLAADLAAMGEALSLVIGGLNREHALIFAAISVLLQVFVRYRRYAPALKFLTLVLFLYVATAFTVHVPWGEAFARAVWPAAEVGRDYLFMVVAVLGTTISPYLFFWQASQEVEEMKHRPGRALKERRPLKELSRGGKSEIERMALDTSVGMVFSNIIAFFIILTTAAVLNAGGVTNIQSAAEAAEALRPLAGDLTFVLFALGIIRTALLAVPVLAGSGSARVPPAFGPPSTLTTTPPHALRSPRLL